jgi:hypothetical protein
MAYALEYKRKADTYCVVTDQNRSGDSIVICVRNRKPHLECAKDAT